MELHRVINPDWRFSDAVPWLLTEIATTTSDLRYLNAIQLFGEDVPKPYWAATYGPQPDEVIEPVREDRSVQVADELRRELIA